MLLGIRSWVRYLNPDLIESARRLALTVHRGQFRRDGVTPYFSHPERVAALVSWLSGSYEQVALAYLHDVLEDAPADQKTKLESEISSTFGVRILQSLFALTHKPSEDYLDYVSRAKKDPLARLVKFADIVSNITDEPTQKQLLKYKKAMDLLTSKVD